MAPAPTAQRGGAPVSAQAEQHPGVAARRVVEPPSEEHGRRGRRERGQQDGAELRRGEGERPPEAREVAVVQRDGLGDVDQDRGGRGTEAMTRFFAQWDDPYANADRMLEALLEQAKIQSWSIERERSEKLRSERVASTRRVVVGGPFPKPTLDA